MNNKYTVFLLLAIVVIAFLWNKNENLDATPLSNEAIQNIASVYNKDNLTATNINATSNLTTAGNLTVNSGMITFPGSKQAVQQGNGKTSFNDTDGANWIRGDRNVISGSVEIGKNLTVGNGMITFPGSKQAVQQGNGKTSFNDTDGANWIRGDRNVISGSVEIGKDLSVAGTLNGGIPTTSYMFDNLPNNITWTYMLSLLKTKFSTNDPDGTTKIGTFIFNGNDRIYQARLVKYRNIVYSLDRSYALAISDRNPEVVYTL